MPLDSRAAGKNEDDILAEARDLRFHLRLRAVADSDHRDDRADTDDDAERGQTERILFRRRARKATLNVDPLLIRSPVRCRRLHRIFGQLRRGVETVASPRKSLRTSPSRITTLRRA